jgi:hypothetical protein
MPLVRLRVWTLEAALDDSEVRAASTAWEFDALPVRLPILRGHATDPNVGMDLDLRVDPKPHGIIHYREGRWYYRDLSDTGSVIMKWRRVPLLRGLSSSVERYAVKLKPTEGQPIRVGDVIRIAERSHTLGADVGTETEILALEA